jgi:hypothetical protein
MTPVIEDLNERTNIHNMTKAEVIYDIITHKSISVQDAITLFNQLCIAGIIRYDKKASNQGSPQYIFEHAENIPRNGYIEESVNSI